MDWFLYDIGFRHERVKYPKNEKSFEGEIKITFTNFRGLSLKPIKPSFMEGKSRTVFI